MPDPDWKLQLRYGKLSTRFAHFSLLAEGVLVTEQKEHGCPAGPAFLGLKLWTGTADEATAMGLAIGRQLGFEVTGRVYLYETEPEAPPGEQPFGYNLNLSPFREAADEQGHPG